jgi:hypothetical protein
VSDQEAIRKLVEARWEYLARVQESREQFWRDIRAALDERTPWPGVELLNPGPEIPR